MAVLREVGCKEAPERKLAEDLSAGFGELGKRSEEVLNMSRELGRIFLGHSQAVPPSQENVKEPESLGFLKETSRFLGKTNDKLSEAMDNLTAILKQF